MCFYKQSRHNIPIALADCSLRLEKNDIFWECIHTKIELFLDPELMLHIYTSNLGWRPSTAPFDVYMKMDFKDGSVFVPVHSMGTDFPQNVIIPLITCAHCQGSSI